MAAITFRAESKATFLAPVEGRDPTNATTLQEGFRITRPDSSTTLAVTSAGNRVATIKSLKILPGPSTIDDVYGLYVESPVNQGPTGTVRSSYSAYIGALTTSPTAPHNYVFGLYVQKHTQSGPNQKTSILSEGDIQVGMTRNMLNDTISLPTGTGRVLSGYSTMEINWADDFTSYASMPGPPNLVMNVGTNAPTTTATTKTVNIGTGSTTGSTTINIGSTTGGTINVNGSLVLNSSTGTGMLSPTYGGTGVNNGSRTLTLATSGSIAGTTGLVATLALGAYTVTLSTGTTANLFVGQSLLKQAGGGAGAFGTSPIITSINSPTQFTVNVAHATAGSITFDAQPYSASANNFVLEAASSGSTMRLPQGGVNDVVLTDLSTATIKNKTIKVGTGGDSNTFQISYDGTASNLTTVTAVTDGNGILATKAYVDSVKTGLDVKGSVRAATYTAAGLFSAAGTFSTSTGMTITATSNIVITDATITPYFDGVSLALGDRVLVKDYLASGTASVANGIYTVTALGVTGTSPWVLTRADDFVSATFTIGSLAANTRTFTISLTSGKLVVGQTISNSGTAYFAANTIITNINGTSVTISAASTNGSTVSTVTCYSTNVSAGSYTFCEEGASGFGHNDNVGFVLVTNQDITQGGANTGLIYVNNVDTLAFTTFQAASTYSATNGISLSTSGVFSLIANTKTVAWLDTPSATNLFSAFDTASAGGTSAGTSQYSSYLTGVGTVSGTFPNSTISAKLVYNISPVFDTGVDANTATFSAFSNATPTTLNIGSGSGVGQGGTLNIGTYANSTGTKTINIGTGQTGGTTNILFGPTAGTSTITLNAGTINNGFATVDMFGSTSSVTNFTLANNASVTAVKIANASTSALTVDIANGAGSNNKTITIGSGSTGGTTSISLGSTATTSTIALNAGTITNAATLINFFNGNNSLTTFSQLDGTALTSYTIGGGVIGSAQTVSIFSGATNTQTITLGGGATANTITKTLNLGTGGVVGSTTNVVIGSNGGSVTSPTGSVKLHGGSILTDVTGTLAVFNANATTINFAGAATTLSMGAGSSTAINLNGTTINSNQTSVGLLNSPTTVTAFQGAGSIGIGAQAAVTVAQANFVAGTQYTISVVGTTNWTSIGASAGTVGTTFIYNGTAITGTGGSATTASIHTHIGTSRYALPVILGTQYPSSGNNPTFTAGQYHRSSQYLLIGTLASPASAATSVRLTADGLTATTSNVPVIPSGATWHVKAFVVVYTNQNSGEGASWEISATFRRSSAGTLLMLGDPVVTAAADTNQTGLILTIQEDTTNYSPQISISGASGTTSNYYCSALLQTLEIG